MLGLIISAAIAKDQQFNKAVVAARNRSLATAYSGLVGALAH